MVKGLALPWGSGLKWPYLGGLMEVPDAIRSVPSKEFSEEGGSSGPCQAFPPLTGEHSQHLLSL